MTGTIPDFRVYPIDDGARVWVHALMPRGQYASYRLKLDLADVVAGAGLHDFICAASDLDDIRQGLEAEGYQFLSGDRVSSADVPDFVPWWPPRPKRERQGYEFIPDPPKPALFPTWAALFDHVARGWGGRDVATLNLAWQFLPRSVRLQAVMVLAARSPQRPEAMEVVRSCVAAVVDRDDAAIVASSDAEPNHSRPPEGEVEAMSRYYARLDEPGPDQGELFDSKGDK